MGSYWRVSHAGVIAVALGEEKMTRPKLLFCVIIVAILAQVSTAQEWSSIANPSTRCGARMIYDAENRRMVMFGGENSRLPWGDHYNDVWVLYGEPGNERWQLLSPTGTPPSPRARFGAIYDSSAQRMVIFGGIRDFTYFFNDVSVLNLESGNESWEEIDITGVSPSPRAGASAIYDGSLQRMLIFGGVSYEQCLNDVWSLDLVNFEWDSLTPSGTPPAPRKGVVAIYDPSESRMIMFGGLGPDLKDSGPDTIPSVGTLSPLNKGYAGYFNDIWSLDLTPGSESWVELSVSGEVPPGVQALLAVYDHGARRMYIFGGQSEFDYPEDVFYLELASLEWRRISVHPRPPGRRGLCGDLDYRNGRVVIFGGNLYPSYYFGDTYAFTVPSVGIESFPESPLPLVHGLSQSYPNPMSTSMSISYQVAKRCEVSLKIFDAAGRLVRVLVEAEMEPGRYTVKWDRKDAFGRELPNGAYFCTLMAGDFTSTKKMVLLR